MLDVDRVATYEEVGVDRNLLIPRYAALCKREAPLAFEEGARLGMKVAMQIAAARERARSSKSLGAGATESESVHLQEDEVQWLVRRTFEIEPVLAEDAPSPATPISKSCTVSFAAWIYVDFWLWYVVPTTPIDASVPALIPAAKITQDATTTPSPANVKPATALANILTSIPPENGTTVASATINGAAAAKKGINGGAFSTWSTKAEERIDVEVLKAVVGA